MVRSSTLLTSTCKLQIDLKTNSRKEDFTFLPQLTSLVDRDVLCSACYKHFHGRSTYTPVELVSLLPLKMSYMLPHLHNGWSVDQAILSEEERVVVMRFGHDWDKTCSMFFSDFQTLSVCLSVSSSVCLYVRLPYICLPCSFNSLVFMSERDSN